MRHQSAFAASALAITLALAACSPASNAPSDPVPTTPPAAPAPAQPAPPAASANVLGLEGLGDLKLGQPVPAGSSWASRGAQASDSCTTISSPDYPGAYAIVEGGKVQRITLGQRSDVKLAEGIGVGDSEADVKKWFAGFREEPHKYEDAPAKYLTAPNAESGDAALRFEIGADGKVKLIHIGMAPVLGYVEGCS
ncbi:hypothetical protein [Caulobacter sp. NIBR1757]|uniref:hypothetical protein n=1 Tax=Caulobacter sp. NIBR1757 TaxID=3016000 RepID=UPI0022F11F91|nr:hypothetical protein [Caulobacter sp. NIBR1757]WGM39920.1 hypothetical protein AMEJIAPC_02860 [Caulobacter sp. NIBR1757]